MTYVEAAYRVLKEAGHPMHHEEIYREVVRRGLWESSAKPQWVSNSTYGHLIKAVQAGDPRLGRVDNGCMFFARLADDGVED